MAKFCHNCGGMLNGEKFCPNCGIKNAELSVNTEELTSVSVDPSAQTAATVLGDQEPLEIVAPAKNGCATPLGGCLSLILMVFLIGLLFSMCASQDIETGGSASTSLTKEQAGELDQQVWAKVMDSANAHNDIMNTMSFYADATVSAVDVYDHCGDVSNYLRETWTSYSVSGDKVAKDYITAARNYTLYVQTEAESLGNYVNSLSTKDLSKVKENIGYVQDGILLVADKRGEFLTAYGYTEAEIAKLVEEIEEQLG